MRHKGNSVADETTGKLRQAIRRIDPAHHSCSRHSQPAHSSRMNRLCLGTRVAADLHTNSSVKLACPGRDSAESRGNRNTRWIPKSCASFSLQLQPTLFSEATDLSAVLDFRHSTGIAEDEPDSVLKSSQTATFFQHGSPPLKSLAPKICEPSKAADSCMCKRCRLCDQDFSSTPDSQGSPAPRWNTSCCAPQLLQTKKDMFSTMATVGILTCRP